MGLHPLLPPSTIEHIKRKVILVIGFQGGNNLCENTWRENHTVRLNYQYWWLDDLFQNWKGAKRKFRFAAFCSRSTVLQNIFLEGKDRMVIFKSDFQMLLFLGYGVLVKEGDISMVTSGKRAEGSHKWRREWSPFGISLLKEQTSELSTSWPWSDATMLTGTRIKIEECCQLHNLMKWNQRFFETIAVTNITT